MPLECSHRVCNLIPPTPSQLGRRYFPVLECARKNKNQDAVSPTRTVYVYVLLWYRSHGLVTPLNLRPHQARA